MLRWLALWTLGCYWLALFVGTHLPTSAVTLPDVNDKLLHCGAYAGLAFLLAATLTASRIRRSLLITLVVAAVYGLADEITQLQVEGRTADLADWAADVAGAGLGALTFALGVMLFSARSRHRASTNQTPIQSDQSSSC